MVAKETNMYGIYCAPSGKLIKLYMIHLHRFINENRLISCAYAYIQFIDPEASLMFGDIEKIS